MSAGTWTRAILRPRTGLAVFAIGLFISVGSTRQPPGEAIPIDGDDIGGVVTGARGPEAGVWVIAETTRPADEVRAHRRHRRSRAATSLPDLPKATYDVWVRGYGLVDSPKTQAAPGRAAEPARRGGADATRGGRVLPGRLLALAACACRRSRSSPAPAAQRHRRDGQEPGRVDPAA